jgi:hypothetical protein
MSASSSRRRISRRTSGGGGASEPGGAGASSGAVSSPPNQDRRRLRRGALGARAFRTIASASIAVTPGSGASDSPTRVAPHDGHRSTASAGSSAEHQGQWAGPAVWAAGWSTIGGHFTRSDTVRNAPLVPVTQGSAVSRPLPSAAASRCEPNRHGCSLHERGERQGAGRVPSRRRWQRPDRSNAAAPNVQPTWRGSNWAILAARRNPYAAPTARTAHAASTDADRRRPASARESSRCPVPGRAALKSRGAALLPLDRGRRFGRDVVHDAVHAGNLVDDP